MCLLIDTPKVKPPLYIYIYIYIYVLNEISRGASHIVLAKLMVRWIWLPR